MKTLRLPVVSSSWSDCFAELPLVLMVYAALLLILLSACAKPKSGSARANQSTNARAVARDGAQFTVGPIVITDVSQDYYAGMIITVSGGSQYAISYSTGNLPLDSLVPGLIITFQAEPDTYGYGNGRPIVDVFQVDLDTAVRNLYRAVLGRDADTGGLNAWIAAMENGMLLSVVRSQIAYSAESATNIDGLYRKILGRPADSGGLVGFQTFLAKNGTLDQIPALLMGSEEYRLRRQNQKQAGPLLYAVHDDGRLYSEPANTLPGASAWTEVAYSGTSGGIAKVAYDLNGRKLVLLDGSGAVLRQSAPDSKSFSRFGDAIDVSDLAIDQGHGRMYVVSRGRLYSNSLISPRGWARVGAVSKAVKIVADAGNDKLYYLTKLGEVYRIGLAPAASDAGERIGSGPVSELAIAPGSSLLGLGLDRGFYALSPNAKAGDLWKRYASGAGFAIQLTHQGGRVYIVGLDHKIWTLVGPGWQPVGDGTVTTFVVAN